MSVQNRLLWQITQKFVFVSFISSFATFVNAQESSALPVKRVLNKIGHHLVDELLNDKSTSKNTEYKQENINQQTNDINNTYPTDNQTYEPNNSNSRVDTSVGSTSPYQNPDSPLHQNPAPPYQNPAPVRALC